jgi:glycosyltransferase involved in cell wall biosynthesis
MDNHFKIIIPLYNVEKWIKICIRSVKAQSYKNFQCIILDDISTDKSVEIIQKEIKGDDRFKLVINTEKSYALKNIYDGINYSNPNSEDIIVTLDGDDWFAEKDVLKKLNRIYKSKKCWLTYGSYAEYPSGRRGKFAKQISKNVINNNAFRKYEWCSSHLRTFKYHLWNEIERNDLLDSEGKFYRMTWDLAFMFPMLEMSGDKAVYVEDILYVYNMSNPLNDHKVDNSYQMKLEQEIRTKKTYNRIIPNKSALELMNANRFDIAAKTLYAKNKIRNINTPFHKELYLQHLKVWNNFEEMKPAKKGQQEFLNSFDSILTSIETNGFDKQQSKIPVLMGTPINGAHRVASCIILEKTPEIYEADISEGQYLCNYEYFKNKTNFVSTGLEDKYLDEMALEFCRNKDNLYTISLFPSHDQKIEDTLFLIQQQYNVIYKKQVSLNDNGKKNYIHNLYYGENWIGPKSLKYPGVIEKTNYCFSNGNEICVILIEEDNVENLNLLKNKVRQFCGVGKHSIHINDTQEETWRIASSVFNENSITFLNNGSWTETPKFDYYFSKYSDVLKNREDRHDFCIDSSAVLSAFGLRDCRDLDFLHLDNILPIDKDIECHNFESHHYRSDKNDIIYDPSLHFYLHGVKFANLQVVRDMKKYRNEEKDRVDVALIEGAI